LQVLPAVPASKWRYAPFGQAEKRQINQALPKLEGSMKKVTA
jgi:hypothetical protein